jgi:phage terminase large subunit GpA-like protein
MISASAIASNAMRVFAPPPDLTCSQWADEYRQLSAESSSEPGQWKTHAFQRDILDAISDQRVRRVVIKACTQVIKTEAILNGIGYFAHQDPGPILVLQPRDADVKAFSKERIAPMIRDTPVLHEIFAESKSRVSDSTIDQKMFKGGMLAITSAGSAPNLARRAIRFLFADEIDKYTPTNEGDAITLARKRLATFRHRAKEILTCSPTLEGSNIDRAYGQSDKRERYVPCPHCGHMQSMMLKFYKQVRWDSTLPTREGQAKSARYHCEECDKPWSEAERMHAVECGEWRATRPFNGVAGFWISELYSPWKQLSEIVLDFLTKKDNPLELQTFINTSLAENWQEQGEAPEWERLLEKREGYAPGTVPQGGLFLTSGVDRQRDRLECEVVAWGRGKESWSVDYRIFEAEKRQDGSLNMESAWAKLAEYRAQTFTTHGGAELPISRMFVDSGDGTTTNDVYSWVRTQPYPLVQAIKGRDQNDLPVGPPSPVDVTVSGKKVKAGLKIRTINVSFFKSEFYAWLKLRAPTDEEIAQGLSYPPGYCHFPQGQNYGDEHFKQICAEQLVAHLNRKTGRTKSEWQQLRPRNEALDCRVYARAAAYDAGMDRWQEKHWQELERQIRALEVEANRPKEPVPVKQQQPQTRRENSWLGDRTKNWLRR